MTDVRDYHNFHLLTDILLLTDVFENFRDVGLQHYGLDPADNYTFPGFTWQAALKMMDVEFYLLTDIDQHLLIEEGIRRGVAMTNHPYARADAPAMEKFDASKRGSYIMNLEASNLYGWAISQPLPMSNFKWLTDEEIKDLYVMIIPEIVQRDIF